MEIKAVNVSRDTEVMCSVLLVDHRHLKTGGFVLPVAPLMEFSDEGSCSAHLLGRENALINYSGLKGVGEEEEEEDGGEVL